MAKIRNSPKATSTLNTCHSPKFPAEVRPPKFHSALKTAEPSCLQHTQTAPLAKHPPHCDIPRTIMRRFACLFIPILAFAAELPPPAARDVDFQKDIQPLFEAACVKCHAKAKDKGGLSLETRDSFLKGGDTGPAALVGDGGKSLIVELVAGMDPDSIMPKKGDRWTPEQVGLLRAWIDQGAKWPAEITFAKPPPQNLHPRKIEAPAGEGNPIDRLLAHYFAQHEIHPPTPVPDAAFARRAYLDVVGLLPSVEQLDAFLANQAADKRAHLIASLLSDKRGYAEHWLTFWNDLLRNDYRGTGFIDGGRKQITGWLYDALLTNKPYDRFVAELIAPDYASEGFTSGILWRGNVNASMSPAMQASQSVAQVFLGVNLKCASCHDSFVSDWTLADAYGLAGIYSDEAMEMMRCDKPTGKKAVTRFLYPEVGTIDPALSKPDRMKRLAELMTSAQNGRPSRTLVNRLWARLFGHGLVEPLDDMEKPAWSRDILDWLAEDLVAHHFDVKHTLEILLTSHAYSLPAVEGPKDTKTAFIFHGPLTRRLTAEQFHDAISSLTGDWAKLPASMEFDLGSSNITLPKWVWTDEPLDLGPQRTAARAAQSALTGARQRLAVAQKKLADSVGKTPAEIDTATKAVSTAAAAIQAAQDQLAAAAKIHATAQPGEWITRPGSDRHQIGFVKKLTLKTVPAEAYATLAASQGFELTVNGKPAKATMTDGFRNGRVKLYDLARMLVAGENSIAIAVESHSEKGMNNTERDHFPQSTNHLNKQSGMAFYLHCKMPGNDPDVQLISDETWSARRSPESDWRAPTFQPTWARATPLPAGHSPVDEAPGLSPIKRSDFANIPLNLGPILRPASSTAAHVGNIRAAMLAADPLQAALDRPNREVIMPARTTAATTMQALELTNGATLDRRLRQAADTFAPVAIKAPSAWLDHLYRATIARTPSEKERAAALEFLGPEPKPEALADLLWTVLNQPEFQLIN